MEIEWEEGKGQAFHRGGKVKGYLSDRGCASAASPKPLKMSRDLNQGHIRGLVIGLLPNIPRTGGYVKMGSYQGLGASGGGLGVINAGSKIGGPGSRNGEMRGS